MLLARFRRLHLPRAFRQTGQSLFGEVSCRCPAKRVSPGRRSSMCVQNSGGQDGRPSHGGREGLLQRTLNCKLSWHGFNDPCEESEPLVACLCTKKHYTNQPKHVNRDAFGPCNSRHEFLDPSMSDSDEGRTIGNRT